MSNIRDNYVLVFYAISFSVIAWYIWKKLTSRLQIKPVFVYEESNEFMKYILQNSKQLHKAYRPMAWLSNQHVQTLLPCLVGWLTSGLEYKRDLMLMEDGEYIAADWVVPGTEERKLKDVIVILPGIIGDHKGYQSLCKVSPFPSSANCLTNLLCFSLQKL